MDVATRKRLLTDLRSRMGAVAEGWYQATVGTAYVSSGAEQTRQYLFDLTEQAILSMLADPFDHAGAGQVGAGLARLHLLQGESIGRTVGVLSRALVGGLDEKDVLVLQPLLGSLLEDVVTGFFEKASAMVLDEQEQIRSALVTALRNSEQALRQAHARLEERVVERTVELAEAITELEGEIAERKRAEEALRESEARWRMLVDNAPDLVLTVDREGRIEYINEMADRSARPLDQVIGQVAVDFAVPGYREMVRAIIESVFETGCGTSFEAPSTGPEGRTKWFAVKMGPIISGGEVSSVLLIARDVTERKETADLKDSVIRDVSHELRTPLAKMQMSLELLLEMLQKPEIDRQKAVHLGARAFDNVERLLGTVEAILDLSSLDAGVKPHRMEDVRLVELIEEAVQDLEALSQARGVNLVADPAPGLPVVQGDAERLYRVLFNLVDNAIKFSAGGDVVISVEDGGGEIRIAVSDSGLGVLQENLERVFERFFQEKSSANGIGVGLTICRAIVEAHGGRIWAESGGRGEGATFYVVLPVGSPERE